MWNLFKSITVGGHNYVDASDSLDNIELDVENRGPGRQLINAMEAGVHVHKLEKIRQDRGVPRVYVPVSKSQPV